MQSFPAEPLPGTGFPFRVFPVASGTGRAPWGPARWVFFSHSPTDRLPPLDHWLPFSCPQTPPLGHSLSVCCLRTSYWDRHSRKGTHYDWDRVHANADTWGFPMEATSIPLLARFSFLLRCNSHAAKVRRWLNGFV